MYRERANANPWNLSGDCSELLRIFGHASNVHTFAYIHILNTSEYKLLLPSFFTLCRRLFGNPGPLPPARRQQCEKDCAAVSVFSRIARCCTCCCAREDDCQQVQLLFISSKFYRVCKHHENKLQRFWHGHPPNEALWQSRSHEVTTKAYKTNQSARTLMYFFIVFCDLFVFLELISLASEDIFEPSTNQAKHLRYRRPVSMESRVHRFKATCVGGSSWGLGIFSFLVSFLQKVLSETC